MGLHVHPAGRLSAMIANIWAIMARRWKWFAAAVVVVLAVSSLRWFGSGVPTRLPQPLVRRLQQHAVPTAIDTADIHRLERSAASAEANQNEAVARARTTEAIARRAA